MANLANKYKLGIFVVGAFIIFLVALILFGFFAFMKPKIKCMTIVDSSVQGLSVGAKVKFSGVPIGEITNIKISTGNLVYIYMEIYSNALAQSNSEDADMSLSEYITEQVKNGLRCQLMYEGITGALYQELQFVDLFQFPSNTIPKPTQDILYIPSIPPVLFGSII